MGAHMNALSPLSPLKRGYAVPLTGEGRVLRTSTEFIVGEEFQLRILDGRVRAETKDVEPETSERDE